MVDGWGWCYAAGMEIERFIGQFLAPFVLLFILAAARPLVRWVERRLPEGKLKRILFLTWS